MRVKDKVAVVTGAASGIGRAVAQTLHHEGARVVLVDRNESVLPGAVSITADVSDGAQVAALFAQVHQRFSRIDIVHNNAGIAVRSPAAEQSEEGWDEVMRVNVRSIFLGCKYAIPYMKERGGSIINTSSVTGVVGVRNRAAYSTSKGAIVTLTRNLALDYAQYGIRVNAICPGFTETPLIQALLRDDEKRRRLIAAHPLGRLGTPEDIARAVLFLASDESSWVTGHALVVDGGFSVGRPDDL
jgi:meso-butanediol dehydrogenase / (S,S)-butanediol dehydrogenase / diacetyl reductase